MTKKTNAITLRTALPFILWSAVLVLADQIVKFLAIRHLSLTHTLKPLGEHLPGLRLLFNPGATLGIGSAATWIITLIALIAAGVILYYGLSAKKPAWRVALILAFAGDLGNIIDRVFRAEHVFDGKVVDMIDYGWSVGNVADIYLTLAAILIVILISTDAFSHLQQDGEQAHE